MSQFVSIRYVLGIPGMLKEMGGKLIIDSEFIKFTRFGKEKARIKIQDIMQVEINKETDFIPGVEKGRSVIGRGLVGGLLFGPAGLVLGGMSGIPKKTVRQSKTKNNWFVLIAFNLNGVSNIAVFKVDAIFFKERKARKIANEIITFRQTALEQVTTSTLKETELYCPHCQHKVSPSSNFCDACGGPLNSIKCPSCSSMNPVTNDFCFKCGIKLRTQS